MPFQIVRNDITKMEVDAIVNATDPSLLGEGGVDGRIHQAAGPKLTEECLSLGGCVVGQAKITRGYQLPCKYVIHTVGPKWRGGLYKERQNLASCYRSSLALAKQYGCESVAFPLISAGTYGYPKDAAMQVATDTISSFLAENDMTVYLVIYGQESIAIGHKLFSEIQEFIDDHYVEDHPSRTNRRNTREAIGASFFPSAPYFGEEKSSSAKQKKDVAKEDSCSAFPHAKIPPMAAEKPHPAPVLHSVGKPNDLDRLFDDIDESFQQMLLRKIDESGMTDAQCYKKANIDRKLFSKIRNDIHYKPKKTTALAFAVALELNLRDTEELLRKAGFALSRSSKFDIIIQYCIDNKHFNIYEINEVLFCYDQPLLGV